MKCSRSPALERLLLGAILVAVLGLWGCAGQMGPMAPFQMPQAPLTMLRVNGTAITNGVDERVVLRGVAFGNEVYAGVRVPELHHNEADFERVAAMGMNSVRFYLNYLTFEEDGKPGVYKKEGWDWLDKNVEWARAHDVFLVLNMHVPPGGYQSLGRGTALWNDRAEQKRFMDLWQAIAGRYAFDSTVAGYDLLNEPAPTLNRAQWHDLANRTIGAIREVDPFHIVFVERVNAVAGNWGEDQDKNFFRVADPNVVYEFHFYEPFQFTHQGAPWTDLGGKEARYPEPAAPPAAAAATVAVQATPPGPPPASTVPPFGPEDLTRELDAYLAWGQREGVPLYLGEFGAIRQSFEQDRGGLRWVSDILDRALEAELSFAYHAYHEAYFALYYGGGLPQQASANQPLIDLFTEKLRE